MNHDKSPGPLARRLLVAASIGLAFFAGAWLFGEPPAAPAPAASNAAKPSAWTCSMHPQIRHPESGQCPICGMDLIPVRSNTETQGGPETITLSKRARTKARIRTAPVRQIGDGAFERHLLGRVDYDETTLRTVTSWTGGRVDRLHVRITGQKIRKAQVIATLYSPEIYSAHQDLIFAKEQLDRLSSGKGATPSSQAASAAALTAARDRLRLLGIPERRLDALAASKKPSEQVPIRSPFGGTVIERLVVEGAYVRTGSGLYRVADLSRLWVQLDAYESDLPLLRLDQEVTLRVEALPGQSFNGRVTFVDPIINRKTRTTRVRIEVPNKAGKLRPGMFAEALVRSQHQAGTETPLVVPDTAPLFTGRRSVVYVEVPATEIPTYTSRVVRLGPKMGDVYPVVAGLKEGERVVIHGAFTLDADLQIKGGYSMMSAPDDNEPGAYDNIAEIPEPLKKPLGALVDHYLDLQKALADDDFGRAHAAATSLVRAVKEIESAPHSEFAQAWKPIARSLEGHSKHFLDAADLDAARPVFRDISQQIATLLRVFGNPTQNAVRLASCPMALDGAGAEWVQRSDEIENPYYGAAMHRCGEFNETVTHGTYLPSKDRAVGEHAQHPAGHQH